jgi:hypothetical protein
MELVILFNKANLSSIEAAAAHPRRRLHELHHHMRFTPIPKLHVCERRRRRRRVVLRAKKSTCARKGVGFLL